MFEVGFSEICLVFIVALLVVGPERLPKLAHTVGLWIGKARHLVNSFKTDIDLQLKMEELQRFRQQIEVPDALFEEIEIPPLLPTTTTTPSTTPSTGNALANASTPASTNPLPPSVPSTSTTQPIDPTKPNA